MTLPWPERSKAFKGVSQFEWAPILDSEYGDAPRIILFVLKFKHYTSTKVFYNISYGCYGGYKDSPLFENGKGTNFILFQN